METMIRRVEWIGAIVGLVLVCACWALGTLSMAGGAALGALFASLNLRLLVWSWRGYVDAQVAEKQLEEGESPDESAPALAEIWPRFVLKYAFLLVGIGVMVLGVKVHMVGFLLGMGNVIVGVAASPLLLKKSSEEGVTDPSGC